jgi:LysR family positive regulator for ilvC
MTGILLRKLIYSQRHVAIYAIQNRGVRAVDLRDLKTFLHLAESRHFGRSARAMHVSLRRFRARSSAWKRTSAAAVCAR